MRHRVRIRKLGRTSSHYEATRRNMVVSLFRHGRVKTTLAKAKSFQAFAEKMITLAKRGLADDPGEAPDRSDREARQAWMQRNRPQVAAKVHRVRRAIGYLQDKEVVRILFEEIAPRYAQRPGGYTRIIKLSKPRLGDAAPTAYLELVGEDDSREERLPRARRRRKKKKGGDAAAAATTGADEALENEEETSTTEAETTEAEASAESQADSPETEQKEGEGGETNDGEKKDGQ